MNALLKLRTETLGLTQSEVADASGITQPTISKMEDGTLKPSLIFLKFVLDIVGEEEVIKLVEHYGKRKRQDGRSKDL